MPRTESAEQNIIITITILPNGQHDWHLEIPESTDTNGPAMAVVRGLLENRISQETNIRYNDQE